jgi:hypothetical protein
MDVAAQLAAGFGGHAIATTRCSGIGWRKFLGALFGGHHPTRAVAIGAAFRRRALRYLCRSTRSQQPQDTRHDRSIP